MPTLQELLNTPERRPKVLLACQALVEDELSRAKGVSGIALRTAFSVIQAVDGDFIQKALDRLFDDFVNRLEPFWAKTTVERVEQDWKADAAGVANALLGAADSKVERVQNQTVKKVYGKLRPKAAGYVQNAVPGLAEVVVSFA
jgi:hypothetical protein